MTYQEIVKALRKEVSMKKEASPANWMNALKGTRAAFNQALPTLPGQKFNEGVPNLGKGYYKRLSNNIYKTTPLQAAGAYAKELGRSALPSLIEDSMSYAPTPTTAIYDSNLGSLGRGLKEYKKAWRTLHR